MAKQQKVTIAGRPYDIDKLEDVAALQAILVPTGFPLPKKEGVRLFLSVQNMAAVQLKRHLAHNFQKILKAALDQQADKEDPIVAVSFTTELNFTALTVAALGKTKMSFSRKFSTEGKPQTFDINQGDFFDEDLSVVLDTKALDAEMAPPAKEDKDDAPEGKKKDAKPKSTVVKTPTPKPKDNPTPAADPKEKAGSPPDAKK